MRVTLAITAAPLLGAFLLGGCNDPFRWQGHWDAPQANLLNQAAQVENWRDLDVGYGDPGSDGQEAAAAVDRLRKGTVKPLAAGTVADIATQGSGTPAAAAPTPGN